MKTIKATITHEGKEIEVEVPIPEGMVFMPQATFDAELTRRATSLSTTAVATAMTAALEDKDHLAAAIVKAKETGLLKDPEPGANDQDIEARIAAERTRWDKDVLGPVQTDKETLQGRNTGLLASRLAAGSGDISVGSCLTCESSKKRAPVSTTLPMLHSPSVSRIADRREIPQCP